MRKIWSEQEKLTLKKMYQAGADKLEICAALNRPPASIEGMISDLRALGMRRPAEGYTVNIPVSRFRLWTDHVILTGDALVICDPHIPYHDASFIKWTIQEAKAAGVTRCILAGDAVEASAFSAWPDDFQPENRRIIDAGLEAEIMAIADKADPTTRAALMDKLTQANRPEGDLTEEVKAAREVFREIDAHFDEIVYIMGNHEDRTLTALENIFPAAELGTIYGLGPKWKISPYYFCELISGGEPWRITHPKNSGKGSSKKLAPKYDANIIQAHGHHFSVQSSPDGRYVAIEPGACVDRARLPYEMQRDTSGDMHTTGAVMIVNGKAALLNKWMIPPRLDS